MILSEKDKPQVSVLSSAKEENSIEAAETTVDTCSLQSQLLHGSERPVVVRQNSHTAEEELFQQSKKSFEIFYAEKDGKMKMPQFTQLKCKMYWTDSLCANSSLVFINDDN